jgi:hypothetical protein
MGKMKCQTGGRGPLFWATGGALLDARPHATGALPMEW